MADLEEEGGARGAVGRAHDPSGEPVVTLAGEIDISNAESLGATLDELVGDETQRLVVDLAALEFMDSSGIAMLLRVAARVGTVEIRNPSHIVRRIIECTGLTEVLRIEPGPGAED
jgi:anti-sigma B factor antagonist